MSRDHRPPIRNPFLPSTPEEPEVPTRDGGHPAGDGRNGLRIGGR